MCKVKEIFAGAYTAEWEVTLGAALVFSVTARFEQLPLLRYISNGYVVVQTLENYGEDLSEILDNNKAHILMCLFGILPEGESLPL